MDILYIYYIYIYTIYIYTIYILIYIYIITTYINIYVYIYTVHVCMCIYIYVYIYIYLCVCTVYISGKESGKDHETTQLDSHPKNHSWAFLHLQVRPRSPFWPGTHWSICRARLAACWAVAISPHQDSVVEPGIPSSIPAPHRVWMCIHWTSGTQQVCKRVSTCSEISRFPTFQGEKKYGWIAVIIHESRLCMQVKTKFIMVSYPKMTSPKMTRNCRGKKTQKNSDLARQPSVAMVHGCTVLQGPRTNSETLRNSWSVPPGWMKVARKIGSEDNKGHVWLEKKTLDWQTDHWIIWCILMYIVCVHMDGS